LRKTSRRSIWYTNSKATRHHASGFLGCDIPGSVGRNAVPTEPTAGLTTELQPRLPNLPRTLAVLFLFAVSFAYVEAAAVVYLRALREPTPQRHSPGRAPGDLLPLVRLDQLRADEPQTDHLLGIELTREFATMLLLLAAGLAVARNFRQGLAAFMI